LTKVQIKRVYEPAEDTDGYRVLADKLYPRGIKKENLKYDLWAKDIAPSTLLRQWYHQSRDVNWDEFRKRYIRELESSPAVEKFMGRVKDQKMVTLLYASKNAAENHALILRDFLESKS